jgi:hypothetical protein
MPRLLKFWRHPLWLVLIFLLSTTALRAQSPSRTITLAEYRAELETAINRLKSIPATASDVDILAVIKVLDDNLTTITSVEFPTGEQVQVASLLTDLAQLTPEDLAQDAETQPPQEVALARLRGALVQINASVHDETAARLALLDQILARPEFNTPVSLLDRFLQWLENLIRDLLPDSRSGTGAGWLALLARSLPWIITIILVAVLIWLLSYWLQRFLRSFVTDSRVDVLGDDDDLPRTAAEAREQARAAAESGFYRDAVRRLYLAALLQLSEHQLIPYERSLTNREVLVRVAADSPIRLHLEPVIATFDQVWYGVREPDQATFTAYEQAIDALAAVAQRTPAIPTDHSEDRSEGKDKGKSEGRDEGRGDA